MAHLELFFSKTICTDAASYHSSDSYSAIAASQAEATGVKKEQTSQEVESAVEENENPFIESVNSFKEIGSDFWSGFQERGDKKMDSLYDFGNYLTSGLFDGVRGAVSAMDERSDKAMASPYDFVNYLTSGGADLVKGAVNPEDDFSKEHWLSSFGLASMVAGAKVSAPKSSMAKMNSIKHTVHPDVTRKVMKDTYQKVVQGPLINTRMDMKVIVRKVLDYKVPWRENYAFAGIGDVSDFAVRDTLNNAKETVHFSVGKREIVSDEKRIANDIKKLTVDDIPTAKNGNFNKFFNSLTTSELDEIWEDKKIRKKIERQLRAPGGLHEWHLVSRAPQFKYWNISAEEIKDLRTAISDVNFVNPSGAHGGLGSTKAHNELITIIDTSNDYNTFVRRLNNWANYRLEGGVMALPKGLRLS